MLPEESRQRTLITLSRVVVEQLTAKTQVPEVVHERS